MPLATSPAMFVAAATLIKESFLVASCAAGTTFSESGFSLTAAAAVVVVVALAPG
jgi:hypothetical protein